MAFFQTKNRLSALDQRLDRIEQALSQVIAQGPNAGGALEKFAVAAVDSQANNLRAMGDFMGTIAEIGASRAASVMGRRRAKTAKRDSKGRMMKRANACRLCENPGIIDPQRDEIIAHMSHGSAAAPPAITYEHRENAVVAHVHEDHIGRGQDGAEQIDCPDCDPKTIH